MHDLINFGNASISLASINGIHEDTEGGTVTIDYGASYPLTFEGTHAEVMKVINDWCDEKLRQAETRYAQADPTPRGGW